MSNLLGKASILTTPTAYDNGKILSVKPNTSVGDFDFTRNSSATRVNAQGLVEDVQILSSNLVSNGDFSQEGSELVTNGSFDSDSGWTLGTGWSIANGNANSDGVSSNSNLVTTSAFYSGSTPVKMTINVTDYVSGGLKVYLSSTNFTEITANGNYTFYTTADRTDGKLYLKSINFIGSIDNVSVKEVGQGWTVSNGTITDKYNASMTAYQTGIRILPFSNTGTFKVTFDLVVTSGSCKFDAGGVNNAIFNTSGTKEIIVTDITKFEFNAFNLGWVGTLDNISVIEITDDTNLPRIDYTDGVGSWLFEPQSTNLVTYSEVYGSGTYFSSFQGSTFDNTTSLSPSGENNASQLTSTGAGKLQTSGISLSQNTDYTLSFYAKNVDATEVQSRVLALGGSGGSNLIPISYFSELSTTEWKRITHSFNTGTNTTFYLYLSNALNSGGTIQIWGAQLEQSSFATSYIPTNGSTVTRLQDAAFGAGSSDLINSTEGVIYWEGVYFGSSGNNVISVSESGSNNYVALFFLSGSTILSRYYNNGSIQSNISYGGLNTTDYFKIAFSWSQDNFSLWVNGVRRSLDTSGNIITPNVFNKINFGSVSNSQNFFGKTKCLAVFKEALTDEELTCLTTI